MRSIIKHGATLCLGLCAAIWSVGADAQDVRPASERDGRQTKPSSSYAGLSADAAKAKFERTAAKLRIEQREALHAARLELEELASQSGLDQPSADALEQIMERMSNANDLAMTLEFAFQERKHLNASIQPKFDLIAEKLSQRWTEYQKFKLDYQPVAGRALASRWTKLSLEQKRCQLLDYLALVDQRPAWLLRTSPIDNAALVPKPVMSPIIHYLGQKSDLLRQAHEELKATIDATARLAKQEADNEDRPTPQRSAAARIAEVLEAPYGSGLRGVLLCVPNDELPENLHAMVQSLLQEFLNKLSQLKPGHQELLRDLHTSLESSRDERLLNLKFEEQMAIDMHLANITSLLPPLRIFANRSTRTDYFEDARLLELNSSGGSLHYRVEFLIDGVTQWVNSRQIVTHQTDKLRQRMLTHIPGDGPGRIVSEETDFATGQVFAYGPAGWKPVLVVDESALGVVVRWQGPAEPIEYYFPRRQLRIVE